MRAGGRFRLGWLGFVRHDELHRFFSENNRTTLLTGGGTRRRSSSWITQLASSTVVRSWLELGPASTLTNLRRLLLLERQPTTKRDGGSIAPDRQVSGQGPRFPARSGGAGRLAEPEVCRLTAGITRSSDAGGRASNAGACLGDHGVLAEVTAQLATQQVALRRGARGLGRG